MIRSNQFRFALAGIVSLALIALSSPVYSSDTLNLPIKNQKQLNPINPAPQAEVKPAIPKTEIKNPTIKSNDVMRTGVPDLISPNPFLSISSENPPNASGAFAGDCLCCYKEGYMPMKTVSCYVRNVGNGPSAPCQAKLSWFDRNNVAQEAIVEIPALKPFSNEAISDSQKHVIFEFPEVEYFSIEHPVTLIIDSNNQVAESREDNNTISFVWSDFYVSYEYQFYDCR